MVKAIETRYKGYRFRSRLEARWAVFFDKLGVKWDYEVEGFELDSGDKYLPDFWIDYGTDNQYWIEIKAHRNLSEREFSVAYQLSMVYPGFVFCGQPELPSYRGVYGGPIIPPNVITGRDKNYLGSWAFSFGKPLNQDKKRFVDPRMYCWHQRDDGSFVMWPVPAFEPRILGDPSSVFRTLKEGWIAVDDIENGNPLGKTKSIDSDHLALAYTAARSARFEHGEKPNV